MYTPHSTIAPGTSMTILKNSIRDSIEVIWMRFANRNGVSAMYSGEHSAMSCDLSL